MKPVKFIKKFFKKNKKLKPLLGLGFLVAVLGLAVIQAQNSQRVGSEAKSDLKCGTTGTIGQCGTVGGCFPGYRCKGYKSIIFPNQIYYCIRDAFCPRETTGECFVGSEGMCGSAAGCNPGQECQVKQEGDKDIYSCVNNSDKCRVATPGGYCNDQIECPSSQICAQTPGAGPGEGTCESLCGNGLYCSFDPSKKPQGASRCSTSGGVLAFCCPKGQIIFDGRCLNSSGSSSSPKPSPTPEGESQVPGLPTVSGKPYPL